MSLFWAAAVFLFAALNLAARLSSFAATSSLITDGLTLFAKTSNGTVITRDCTDVWSCPVALCQVKQLANLTSVSVMIYPPTSDRGSSCAAQGLGWMWEFGYARAAVMFLVMACLFQALGPICGSWNKIYAYTFIGTAYVCLIFGYIFELIWTINYADHRHDYQPAVIKGWNMALSIFLVLGAGIADVLYLFPSADARQESTPETPLLSRRLA